MDEEVSFHEFYMYAIWEVVGACMFSEASHQAGRQMPSVMNMFADITSSAVEIWCVILY
jgi:hypothetical protein